MQVLALLMLCGALAAAAAAPADLRHVEAFLAHAGTRLRRRHRPLYHLSAPLGWLSEPAAFVFFKRKYHLFYQYHPYEGAWGPPAWGHAASSDLAAWAHYPPALLPHDVHDSAGCLAGSALPHRHHLALFYTGHALERNHTRATHSVAVSADGVLFNKYAFDPVLRRPPPHADAWRNPRVWRHEGAWHMVVGAAVRGRGALLRFTSPDLYAWRANGTAATSIGDMGAAWENPDVFELDGYCVVVLSTRGVLADEDRFRNPYVTGYVLGRAPQPRLDCARAKLDDLEVSTATFEELDHGHDLCAAKTTRAPDGRRLLVAALGMADGRFEEARDGWAGMMTLVRELRVGRGGRLLQVPAREMKSLRKELIENASYEPGESFSAGARAFELLVNASSISKDAGLALEWGGKTRYSVRYWARLGRVGVARAGEGAEGARRADWAPGALRWRMFVDRSSVEVFCGAGEVVFSSRVYPRGAITLRVLARTPLHFTQYRLKPSIGYDSKLTNYLREHVLA